MLSRRKFMKLGGLGAVLAMSHASVPVFISKAFAGKEFNNDFSSFLKSCNQ